MSRQLIVAVVPGTSVQVPKGLDVGGTFQHLPLGRALAQTGCVIAYSSYPENPPPPFHARYGRSARPVWEDACVHPAANDDAQGALDAALPLGNGDNNIDLMEVADGIVHGHCTKQNGLVYLAISTRADRRASIVDNVLLKSQQRRPGWGLHVIDLNLALVTLVNRVGVPGRQWLTQQAVASTATAR